MTILATYALELDTEQRIVCKWVDGNPGVDPVNRLTVRTAYGDLIWDEGVPRGVPVGVLEAMYQCAQDSGA